MSMDLLLLQRRSSRFARGTRKTVHGFIALGVTFERLPLLGWAVTLLFVFVGWLCFFYPVTEATRMLRLLFTP